MIKHQVTTTADRAKVSALVVGIETYDFGAESGFELRGSVRCAAQFASWLLKQEVCDPGRITLMTAYNEDAITNGTYPADRSPVRALRELAELEDSAAAKINWIRHQSNTAEDFKAWLLGDHGPRESDEKFLLFWVGHGLTYPFRPLDPRLCLLGSDASFSYQPSHVELTNLVDVVAKVVPGVYEVAFIDACRDPVRPGLDEERLSRAQRWLSPPESPKRRGHSIPELSMACAAAEGTTRQAGWRDLTFAEWVLAELDRLPAGAGPEQLFDSGLLKGAADALRSDPESAPNIATFSYLHRSDPKVYNRPAPDFDVTSVEWQSLLETARAIDSDPDIRTAPRMHWGAFCHAVRPEDVLGPNEHPDSPQKLLPALQLDTLEGLFKALDGLSPKSVAYPPPLVVACDFVANLPATGTMPALDEWCGKWARDRLPTGPELLKNAAEQRPATSPDADYLCVMVDHEVPSHGPRIVAQAPSRGPKIATRYLLKGFVWTLGGPHYLGDGGPVDRSDVAAAVAGLLARAGSPKMVASFKETLVELVLPRDLIGLGLEYDIYKGNRRGLGFKYNIAIGALDRLRDGGEPAAMESVAATWRRMGVFEATESSPWSERIEWIDCSVPAKEKYGLIGDFTGEAETFCFVLQHGHASASRDGHCAGRGAPITLLKDSLDTGAALILTLHSARRCAQCPGRSDPRQTPASECLLHEGRGLIEGKVNGHPNGLFELPFIITGLRSALASYGLKANVYMEHPGLLSFYLLRMATGARSGQSSGSETAVGLQMTELPQGRDVNERRLGDLQE